MLEMHFDILIEHFSPNQLSRIRPNLDSEEHLIGGGRVSCPPSSAFMKEASPVNV